MKAAFDVLGLAPDADERTIKRAYAALLKLTRPDDDPEGFQRLNDAYRQALEYARCRQKHDADTPERTQTEAPDLHEQAETRTDARAATRAESSIEEDAPSVETISFDPEAFYARLIVLLAYCQDGELRRWLEAQPILWSLADKARLAGWLLYRLHEDEPPVPASQFDQFATYFALYDLYGGFDAFAVHALRHRLHLVWELRTPQLRALAERTRDPNTPLSAAMRETRRALRQLQRPLRWPQALFAGLLPGFPSTVRRFAYRLDRGRIDALPPPIVPAQVTFWDAAADRSRMSKQRFALVMARCATYALLGALLFTIHGVMFHKHYAPKILGSTFAFCFASLAVVWSSIQLGQTFLHWQCRPDRETGWHRILRYMTVPCVAIASILMTTVAKMDVSAALLGITGFITSLRRYRARGGTWLDIHEKVGVWILTPIFLCIIFLSYLSEREPRLVISMIPATAMIVWAMDFVRRFRKG